MFEAAPHPGLLKFMIAAVAVAAAILFLILHIRTRRKEKSAASWPTVPGVVTGSRMLRRWGLGDGIWIAGLWYVPEVSYRYEVEGREFSSRRVYLSETGFPKLRAASAVIARYPKGDGVTVHYDPSHPKRACLEPVRRESRFFGIAILLIAVAFAALVIT
jgi:hypothetical protein